ncbi:MAG: DNA repair protein RadC [Bacteroidales bacterium]|nr:DNA repair protein RadC [Bacteroidales bacterium]
MKIKDWCAEERPREKMLEKGARALGNAELLAILLRTGMKGMNVMEVAQKLLSSVGGSLTAASGLTVEELCRIEGIGPGKAVSVVAALELGKRMCAEAPESDPKIIYSAADVYREMLPVMRGLHHEECWLFYLARNGRIIVRERLSSGGQSETVVDIKTIVRRAIDTRACGVVMAHNHPSGDPNPGEADKKLTVGLLEALETFDIKLVDHVIIADGLYYSFSSDSVSAPDSNARPKKCPVGRAQSRMVSEKKP